MEGKEQFGNLVKYVEDNFSELENAVLCNLEERDCAYKAVCRQLRHMIEMYPFIAEITEGVGKITISEEEHRVLTDFFKADLEKEELERMQLYFQGHIDGYAYMKKIGMVFGGKGE
ncbi:hypothetical protein AALD22_24330 [Lachnospiraceae bacterium 56-18]